MEHSMVVSAFKDDPAENARLCLRLALRHCQSCNDFHLGAIMRRAGLPADKRVADAEEFRAAMSHALARLGNRTAAIRVLIAGSTDTGLYVELLNAALAAGANPSKQLCVVIVDQCETPLELCRRLAADNNLVVETIRANLSTYSPDEPFDLVIMHGVLTFFSAGDRNSFLRHAREWLAPDGLLISSAQHGERSGKGEAQERIDHALGNLQRFIDEAGGYSASEIDELRNRVRNGMRSRQVHAELFAGKDEASAFYEAAGLIVESLQFIDNRARTTAGLRRRYSERSIAICSRASTRDLDSVRMPRQTPIP